MMALGSLTMLPLVGVLLLQVIAVFFIAGLLQKDAKPAELGKGVFCVLAQSLGAVLMSAAGLPTLYAVLARQSLPMGVYLSLLLVFGVGGVIYLKKDMCIRELGAASRVPASMMHVVWRLFGLIVFLGGVLSLCSQVLVAGPESAVVSMPTHLTAILYGGLLLVCTREPKKRSWLPWKKRKK